MLFCSFLYFAVYVGTWLCSVLTVVIKIGQPLLMAQYSGSVWLNVLTIKAAIVELPISRPTVTHQSIMP